MDCSYENHLYVRDNIYLTTTDTTVSVLQTHIDFALATIA